MPGRVPMILPLPPGRDGRRPPPLRRAWLFLPGADRQALSNGRADVLIQELEDFTPPEQRPQARAMAADILKRWRAAGMVAAVRINPPAHDRLQVGPALALERGPGRPGGGHARAARCGGHV